MRNPSTTSATISQNKNTYVEVPGLLCQLSPDDLNILLNSLSLRDEKDGSSQLRVEHIQAQYPVNIVDMTDHSDGARVGSMIQQFVGIALEEHSPNADSD